MSNVHPANFAKVRCFGSSAALTVEAQPLLKNGAHTGQQTVNLEVAPKSKADAQPDWTRKIQLQVTEDELIILCSVFMGLLPGGEFKRKGKGIAVERQHNKMFVSASAGRGNIFALPITISDTFKVGMLLLNQLKSNYPLTSDELLLSNLRGASALYRVPNTSR